MDLISIGNCERCGVIDHHLIEGFCAQCDDLVTSHANPKLDSVNEDYDQVPLGVEAGHVIGQLHMRLNTGEQND